jgi:hypothetical protein
MADWRARVCCAVLCGAVLCTPGQRRGCPVRLVLCLAWAGVCCIPAGSSVLRLWHRGRGGGGRVSVQLGWVRLWCVRRRQRRGEGPPRQPARWLWCGVRYKHCTRTRCVAAAPPTRRLCPCPLVLSQRVSELCVCSLLLLKVGWPRARRAACAPWCVLRARAGAAAMPRRGCAMFPYNFRRAIQAPRQPRWGGLPLTRSLALSCLSACGCVLVRVCARLVASAGTCPARTSRACPCVLLPCCWACTRACDGRCPVYIRRTPRACACGV